VKICTGKCPKSRNCFDKKFVNLLIDNALNILFEDYYLLIVDKPAGLSSESGKARHPSAEDWALQYFTSSLMQNSTSKRLKATPFLRVAHRLDRVASGVLVFAKTKAALTGIMEQFERRETEKIYRAVVAKAPALASGALNNWLKKDVEGKKALIFDRAERDSVPCALEYNVLEQKNTGALLEIKLLTGRYHQIRAQLAHIGCPIAGDVLYGGKPWRENTVKLHAQTLAFKHPKTGVEMRIEAPTPEDW
jgi:23S rRNA pseudouridine1911/1915/1917 synthase